MKKWMIRGGVLASCAAAVLTFERLSAHVQTDSPAARMPGPVDLSAVKAGAERGEVESEVQLARLYAQGQGTRPDYALAAKWYGQAADQGNAEARACLGELQEAGQGVARDQSEAIRLYRLAAGQGNVRAQYNLGYIYERGNGVGGDKTEAAKWYRLAAEGGDALAQYDLGQRYNLGVGVPADRVEGLKWLNLAAAQGQSDAAGAVAKAKAAMSGAEIEEARKRAAGFVPRKQ